MTEEMLICLRVAKCGRGRMCEEMSQEDSQTKTNTELVSYILGRNLTLGKYWD